MSLLADWFGQGEDMDHSPTPLAALTEEERKKILWKAVQKLPRKQAEVVSLRYLEGSSLENISSVLGIATGTVKSRLFNALERLRKYPEVESLKKL